MLAGSLQANTDITPPAPAAHEPELKAVTVRDAHELTPQAKDQLRVRSTGVAKGQQALRDIPQSVTVLTEKWLDDRNLDDFRQALKATAGITFQAGETGEEDVRLRGFSLAQAGDIYVDGLRDAPLTERDTFNTDRIEVLKGSASMLFGKGSTGGVVNQVSKQPYLMTQHEATTTVGTGGSRRVAGDFNWQTSATSAVRLNAMHHEADHGGAKVHKKGVAVATRFGIGERDEFSVGLQHLQTHGRPLYNHPWMLDTGGEIKRSWERGTIVPVLPAGHYYGLASDHLRTQSSTATLGHTHRFGPQTQLKTTLRHGRYERDLWASVVGFADAQITQATLSPDSVLTRKPKGRYGQSEVTQLQSDWQHSFTSAGVGHTLLVGAEWGQERAGRNNWRGGAASGLTTTVGTPNDGDWREDTRGAPALNTFVHRTLGVYAQDTLSLSDTLKVVAGMRHDRMTARYVAHACDPATRNDLSEGLWSPRLGVLFQPSATASYYASVGTSYNTSGDTYGHSISACAASGSSNAKLLNTAPEKSRNFEVGGKFELFNQQASLGVALFHSQKYNERNTDPDSAAAQMLLSGKRHATGLEFNLAGRITPAWEVLYSHTWIPSARIDTSAVAPAADGRWAQVQGDRPALTPRHSASAWSTYRLGPQWRVGAGMTYRGAQQPEGARHITAKAFATLDAMAEYAVSDKTALKLNVSNLRNTRYADTLYRGFFAPGAPRRVELSLKTSF